jgi:hypothetical protein
MRIQVFSVADPRHVEADPDTAFHFDADSGPDPTFHSDADPDPTFQFNADPDPTTHFFQIWTFQCSKMNLKGFHLSTLMQIRILLFTVTWIRIQLFTL